MSTTRYQVTGEVCQVSPSGTGQQVIIYNEGPDTVYVSENAVSGSNGFPVEPTGNITRDGDMPLFMTCPTGTSYVQVSHEVSSVLPLSTMASNIADGIVGGVPLTSTDIAAAIYNQGVIAVNAGVNVASGSTTSAPGGNVTILQADVSRYQNVTVNISTVVTLGAPSTTSETPLRFRWYGTDDYLTSFLVEERYYMQSDDMYISMQVACRGGYLEIIAEPCDDPAAVIRYEYDVWGSAITVERDRCYIPNRNIDVVKTPAPNDGAYRTVRAANVSCAPSASTDIPFACHAGRAYYSFSIPSATLAYSASLYTNDGTLIHYFNKAAGDVRQAPVEVILPPMPMMIRVILGAEAAARNFGATIQMEGKY